MNGCMGNYVERYLMYVVVEKHWDATRFNSSR